ncbi:lysozyme [Salmonella enterica]
MNISANGVALLKELEGCRLRAYLCPAGVWTIGFGWTGTVDGRRIREGMQINRTQAEQLLRMGLVEFERAVNRLVTVRLTQAQFDALVSFAYNIGSYAFSTSTLLRKLNQGDYAGAAAEFPRWNKSAGKEMPGLTKRRKREMDLFLNR